jgi:hypothetical protein
MRAEHMQMVCSLSTRVLDEEQVVAVVRECQRTEHISEPPEPRDVRCYLLDLGHDHHDVNDRLGRQPGNAGRPYMLDARRARQHLREQPALSVEVGRPTRVVGNHFNDTP